MDGKWYALFSQTGQEVRDLSARLGRNPDEILTTRVGRVFADPDMRASNDSIQSYLHSVLKKGDLVTLHGYMYIISTSVLLKGATVLNGHPGLVPLYPELAGRDPQEKFIDNQKEKMYPMLGSIVHTVTRHVDRGPLVAVSTKSIPEKFIGKLPRDAVYESLRQTSMEAWLKALEGVL